MIPYSRPKPSDLYTLSQSKLLKNHTLQRSTYLYSPYTVVSPPPPRDTRALRETGRDLFLRDPQNVLRGRGKAKPFIAFSACHLKPTNSKVRN